MLVLTLKPLHCPLPDRIDVQPGVTWESPRKGTVRVGDPGPPVERPGGLSTRSQRLLLLFAPSVFQGVNGIVTMLGNKARAHPLGHFQDTRQAKRLATRRGRLTRRTAAARGELALPFAANT